MFQTYVRSLTVSVVLGLVLLMPALVLSAPGVDWVRVHPYYRSVGSGCVCNNGTLRMLVGDTLVAFDLEGLSEWDLSWEEDNTITTLARAFDRDCGICYIDQPVDEPKTLIMYKYDSSGTFLWETELKLSDELSHLVAVGTDNQRNAYLICDLRRNLSDGNSPQQIQVLKVRPDGKIEWQANDDEGMASVRNPAIERRWTSTPLALVDTTGTITIVTSDAQLFRIFRYNAHGALVWDQTFDPLGSAGSASFGPVTAIEGLPQGSVVLTTNHRLVRYDATGICDTTFEFPALRLSNRDALTYFGEDASNRDDHYLRNGIHTFDERGNLYIGWNHDKEPNGDTYIELCKYDPNQKLIWSKIYGENDQAAQSASGVFTRSGRVLVTGQCFDQLNRPDGLMLLYDEFGSLLLDKRYDSPEHVSDQITSALADDKGNFYIIGLSVPLSGVGDDAVFMLRLSDE